MLHDEIQSLNLELNQVIVRNEALKVDNASLLQRWIDHQNDQAAKMNSANSFYEDMRRKGWGDRHKDKDGNDDNSSIDSSSVVSESGNGSVASGDGDEDPFRSPQGQPPPKNNGPRLTPNG